uniref:SPARK domain-containing protein n=1 Tax=Chenopodium quinoa TaxID=63459 RepID=A0A803M1X7_CHEQI
MRGGVFTYFIKLQFFSSVLVLFYATELYCTPLSYFGDPAPDGGDFLPMSPFGAPQPLLPFLAPSPLTPFTNSTVPKLSGACPFNFTAAESMMGITATDCFTAFAPYLANVVCCPQLHATLVILMGQSSKKTKLLALNETHSKQCLSDVNQVLVSQGANNDLQQICKIRESNLTEGSCPVKDVSEFEKSVDTSKLLASCQKIDLVKECCSQTCQNALSEAARNLSSKLGDLNDVPQLSDIDDDCQSIVLRWLASKLNPSRAKEVIRGLSNCHINKVCPLTFPDTRHVAKKCANVISNQTACCSAIESYVSHLQNQSFVTNLQALNCAAALGLKLQRENVTTNVYDLCHVSLKQFSVQESGCLLQSLPSDVTFDKTSGITFLCDLNDNIPAPWPSALQLPASSCNKNVFILIICIAYHQLAAHVHNSVFPAALNIPALPAAASGETGLHSKHHRNYLLMVFSLIMILY